MSLAQAIIGIGMMGYPIVIHFLMETYGFRGMCAIVAAINANIIAGMIAMHPVKWHYKIIEVPAHEMQPCKSEFLWNPNLELASFSSLKLIGFISVMNENTKNDDAKINMTTDDEFEMTQRILSEPRLSIQAPNEMINKTVREDMLQRLERSKSLDPTQQYSDFEQIRHRLPSLMSLGDWNGSPELNEYDGPTKNKKWFV